MSDVLGLGLTHYPMLLGPDRHMAGLLRTTLDDPDIPADRKDPASWSDLARQEWGEDQGVSSAQHHRSRLRAGLERCRAEVDAFEPDVVIVWGDDQYENFREQVIPPFCVLAYQDTEVDPFGLLRRWKMPNYWGLTGDTTFTMRGSPETAKTLTAATLDAGIDCAYSYELRKGINFPHSFANTQVFLDFDNVGREFPYPIVPIAVNCYGEHVIARQGGMARFAEITAGENLDPPGPSPARCFEFGRAVGRYAATSGKRVALVASSSWSHAFLNDKDWHLRPDTDADQALYRSLVDGDHATWEQATTRKLVSAGQHEMLNWFCLVGATSELGLELAWSDFVATEIFNSNKVFAVFRSSDRASR